MIETVVVAVAGSLTAITSVSLWFASAIDRRERDRVEREERAAEDASDDGHFTHTDLQPFTKIFIETMCPYCGLGGTQKSGPKVPKVCHWADKCTARETPHLHVECQSCKARWPMSDAESDQCADDAILPFVAVFVGTKCAKCGEPADGVAERGPVVPQACSNPSKCKAKAPHLHMRCLTCGSKWFMAPASAEKKKQATRRTDAPT